MRVPLTVVPVPKGLAGIAFFLFRSFRTSDARSNEILTFDGRRMADTRQIAGSHCSRAVNLFSIRRWKDCK